MSKAVSASPIHTPTVEELKDARRRFREYEPRDLFYRVASELIDLALAGKTRITVAEALAVLLQTWNAQYYQFRPFTEEHFREIEKLLQTDLDQVLRFRNRSIDFATKDDLETVEALFNRFEQVLGPVGAVKSLQRAALFSAMGSGDCEALSLRAKQGRCKRRQLHGILSEYVAASEVPLARDAR